MLPERGAEYSVGCLYLLALRCHSAEVALVKRGVESSLQRGVDVGQSHQVLCFLIKNTNTQVQSFNRETQLVSNDLNLNYER